MGYEGTRSSVSSPLDGVVLEQKRFVVYLVEISGRGSVKNQLKGQFGPSANMANYKLNQIIIELPEFELKREHY